MGQISVKREEYKGQSGKLIGVMKNVDGRGMYRVRPGVLTSTRPDNMGIAEIDQVGCFPVALNWGDPKGKYPLDHNVFEGTNAYTLAEAADQALPAGSGHRGAETSDKQLWEYVDNRRVTQQVAFDDYGLPGLVLVRAAYRKPEHGLMIARLTERLKDPAFARGKSGFDVASARAIVRNPERFMPCPADEYGLLN